MYALLIKPDISDMLGLTRSSDKGGHVHTEERLANGQCTMCL